MSMRAIIITAALLLLSACWSSDPAIPKDLEACGKKARCGNGPMFVINRLMLPQIQANGTLAGFNLDGIVSDGKAAVDCHTKDFVSPSGEPGIDNQLVNLMSSFTDEIAGAFPLLIQNAIGTGGLLLIGELIGIDDPVNDKQVGIVFRRSEDVPLVGTDNLILDNQTFKLAANHYAGSFRDGYIENGRFKAGPFDLAVKIIVFGVNYFVTFRGLQLDFAMNATGTVESGIFGGAVHLDDINDVAETIVVEELGDLIKAIVPPFADVRSEDGKCELISGALEMTAIPAFVFDQVAVETNNEPLTGEQIFVKATCIGCHAVKSVPGARSQTGPSLDGLAARAGKTVPGKTAEEYITQSILNPEAYIVEGYEPMSMPATLRAALTNEEFDTLLAWLLTL